MATDLNFLATFLDEADETLVDWESACLALERAHSKADVDRLFRTAHNLKGSARSIGLDALGQFLHAVEDAITLRRDGKAEIDAEFVALMLECQSSLVRWVLELRTDPEFVADTSALLRRLGATQKVSEPAAFGFFDDPPAETKDLGTLLVEAGHVTQEQVERGIKLQNRKLGEILVDEGLVPKTAVEQALAAQQVSGSRPDESMRVSAKKLDGIIRLVGELSIQLAIVKKAKESDELAAEAPKLAIDLASKILADLQSESMSARMQPLAGLFQRLERVARDVARSQGKAIRVEIRGGAVELDKTVTERIKDPLVHLLRNAVDHGIEAAALRKAAKKPNEATIEIIANQTPGGVEIKIVDDGKGLDEAKVLKKAIEKGLVTRDQVLSPSEIRELIFRPGFSTADNITEISGRGVGLDVVQGAADELKGKIAIDSTLGKGTTFCFSLPSTLSILDAVVVGVGNMNYTIPIHDIDEVIELRGVRIETTAQNHRMINLRGEIIPVERLSSFLPCVGSTDACAMNHVAVITTYNSQRVAFEIDGVASQETIVVRRLEGGLEKLPYLSGSTILADGAPSMILHLPHVAKSYFSNAEEPSDVA